MFQFIVYLIIALSIYTNGNATVKLSSKDANIQIIHNSADTSLRLLDLYLNGEKIVSGFSFREATSFFSIKSDTLLQLDIARSPSKSSSDKIKTFPFEIEKGKNAVLLLQGIYDTLVYQPNPNGKSIVLSLDILDNITLIPTNSNEIPTRIINGCTNLVETNLTAKDIAPLLINMTFRSSTPTDIIMPASEYHLLLLEAQTQHLVKEFTVNLSAFSGEQLVLFFSGFENVQNNQNGKKLGLFGAKSNGTIINFQNTSSVNETNDSQHKSSFIVSNLELNTNVFKPNWEEIQIYDLLGSQQLLFVNNFSNSNLNLNNFLPGVYVVFVKYKHAKHKDYRLLLTD